MNYRRAIIIVLLILIAICAAMEGLTRILLPRMSHLLGREIRERDEILSPPQGPARRILFVGNSLLLEGVDFPTLQTALLPAGWEAHRFSVDNTFYLDWYYGLRRLFLKGARFDAVAVMLTPQQLAMSRVRGSYSAWRLMSPFDIAEVARDAGLSPTEEADLFLSSVSEFYGMREELRKVLLARLIPNLPGLLFQFVTYPRWEPHPDELVPAFEKRLLSLRELGAQNRSKVLLVIPPISTERDGSDSEILAGERTGVAVLAPIRSGTLPASDYRDGFHLNEKGSPLFTAALAEAMKAAMK